MPIYTASVSTVKVLMDMLIDVAINTVSKVPVRIYMLAKCWCRYNRNCSLWLTLHQGLAICVITGNVLRSAKFLTA